MPHFARFWPYCGTPYPALPNTILSHISPSAPCTPFTNEMVLSALSFAKGRARQNVSTCVTCLERFERSREFGVRSCQVERGLSRNELTFPIVVLHRPAVIPPQFFPFNLIVGTASQGTWVRLTHMIRVEEWRLQWRPKIALIVDSEAHLQSNTHITKSEVSMSWREMLTRFIA